MKAVIFWGLLFFTFSVSGLPSFMNVGKKLTEQEKICNAIRCVDLETILNLVTPYTSQEDLIEYCKVSQFHMDKEPEARRLLQLKSGIRVMAYGLILSRLVHNVYEEVNKKKLDFYSYFQFSKNVLNTLACACMTITLISAFKGVYNNIWIPNKFQKQQLIHLYLKSFLKTI